MLQKYTKFCTADTLIKIIETQQKDQQAMHILLSVFKKSLSWAEEKFDRQGLFDAIHRISIKKGVIAEPLVWMFSIKGSFTYHDMPFYMSEYIKFTQPSHNYLSFIQNGLYAVLTLQDYQQLQSLHQKRQTEKIQKFIKINMFYPYYLQDHNVKEFYSLIRIKRLKYNKYLNWKDEDHSNKIAVIFRGLVNIEYQWKRTIQVAQLAKGIFISNHYIKDYIQEIQDLEWQKIEEEPEPKKTQSFPKFKYISKSDDTILLIFNARLINQSPFNINSNLLPNIKQNYESYMTSLENTIGLAQYNKLYRNKLSIKEQLKKKKQKQQIKKDISLDLSNFNKSHSPLVKTFATLQLQTHRFDTIKTIELPQPTKQYSKSVFTTIPNPSSTRSQRSKTTQIQRAFSSRKMIHNTWLQQISKKKKDVKSFSMLRNLTTYNPDRHKKEEIFIEELKAEKKPEFFIPNQFVKRKLKLKYQGLVDKMKHMDLKISKSNQQSVSEKMQRLQQYIDSKRIVKIGNAKRKFKLLRDKVQY